MLINQVTASEGVNQRVIFFDADNNWPTSLTLTTPNGEQHTVQDGSYVVIPASTVSLMADLIPTSSYYFGCTGCLRVEGSNTFLVNGTDAVGKIRYVYAP